MNITIENIKKAYKKQVVLNIGQLQFSPGLNVILGNNGSGKSTLLKIILDLIKPGLGRVLYNSMPMHKDETWKSFVSAYLGDEFLIDFLTYQESKKYLETLSPSNKPTDEFKKLESLMLSEHFEGNKLIRELSSGNKAKAGILLALFRGPKVLVLDEPHAHLDSISQDALDRIIQEWLGNGQERTVIMTNHHMSGTYMPYGRVITLENGMVVNDSGLALNTETAV